MCRSHLLEDVDVPVDTAAAFGSVVRQALRGLEKDPDSVKSLDRWQHTEVRGLLTGPNGSVSDVMGVVGAEDTLWSRKCLGIASHVDGRKSVARCTHCKHFYRRGVIPRAENAALHTPPKNMRNDEMSTAQKVSGRRA